MNAFVALGIACAIVGLPLGVAAMALLAANADHERRIEEVARDEH